MIEAIGDGVYWGTALAVASVSFLFAGYLSMVLILIFLDLVTGILDGSRKQ